MNNKGFTLVELLATIVIIGLVMGIASYNVIGTINNSNKRSEALFVESLSGFIKDYLLLNNSMFYVDGNEISFTYDCNRESCPTGKAYELKKKNGDFKVRDIVDANLVNDNKLVNPVNKKVCFDTSINPIIRVFRDENYVYYYYVDLKGNNTKCEVSDENGIINTLPNDLRSRVGLQ